jgi:hypothetical protein
MGSPSRSGRRRVTRKLAYEVRNCRPANVPTTRTAGQRVVVLGEALLDRVARHDEQDDVERGQRGELAPSDHARDREDEEVEEDGAEDEIHGYG